MKIELDKAELYVRDALFDHFPSSAVQLMLSDHGGGGPDFEGPGHQEVYDDPAVGEAIKALAKVIINVVNDPSSEDH